jgi:hypothetical protein
MTLERAGLAVLATELARQHWETWLVSLYVLLGGDAALEEMAGDDIRCKRKLARRTLQQSPFTSAMNLTDGVSCSFQIRRSTESC